MSEDEFLIQNKFGEGLRIEDGWGDMKDLMTRDGTCLKRSC